ncbi:hypothetical protein L7F22_038242 [Adiantum nelumboides]|nr:hypothetical protein [Adiantum nelumboides]
MPLFVRAILQITPVLAMALLHSFREPGHTRAFTCKLTNLSPMSRQLHSPPLHKFNSFSLQVRPSWYRVTSLSSSSSALEAFQRLWVARVSPPLHAMESLAVNFSHLLSALAVFLQQKAMEAKANSSFCQLYDHDVNTLLAETNSNSLKRRLSGHFMEQGGLAMALMSTTAIAKDHLNPVIATLCANPTFMSGLVAWTIAQVFKVFTTFFVERRWDFKMLLGSGGMPSSHSALCVALTTSVALCHGISDALFPVCLGFSLIVMYDATGVRRHAGMQAEVLNLIVEDLFQGHPISEKKLKELLGHTPLQVGAGAFVGIMAGYLCSQGYAAFPGHGF